MREYRLQEALTFLFVARILALLLQATFILGSDVEIKPIGNLEWGHGLTLVCTHNTSNVDWWRGSQVLTNANVSNNTRALKFEKLSIIDINNYTCKPSTTTSNAGLSFEVIFNVPAILETEPYVTIAEGTQAMLKCNASGYPLTSNLRWELPRGTDLRLESDSITPERNITHIFSTLYLRNVTRKYGGLFVCKYEDVAMNSTVTVTGAPTVTSLNVHVVGKSRIYVSWAVDDGNLKLKRITLTYQSASAKKNVDLPKQPAGSFIILDLVPKTNYSGFSLQVANDAGTAQMYNSQTFLTFAEDVHFVPDVSVKGLTTDTVTLGWHVAQNLTALYHYFKILVNEKSKPAKEYLAKEIPFMVETLNPGSNYSFVVRACSNYTDTCDSPSPEVSATTMDGISSSPKNVQVVCDLDRGTNEVVVYVTWDTPDDPRGFIAEYTVTLTGNSTYLGDNGQQVVEAVGPQSRNVQVHRTQFTGQLPNTYVHVSVCAKTRSRMCGPTGGASCSTPSSLPHQEELSKASWKMVYQKNRFYFLMTIPHISHRNGSICCLRVVVVRLTNSKSLDSLQPPHLIKLQTYAEVHSSTTGGAYVAELLEPERKIHNIMIGDGQPAPDKRLVSCPKCSGEKRNSVKRSREAFSHKLHQAMFPEHNHRKRHSSSGETLLSPDPEAIHDGPLDSESTYTAYLEAIILTERNEPLKAQSKYMTPLKRSPDNDNESDPAFWGSILLGSAVITLSIVFVAIVCLARARKERRPEGLGLSHSIQYWCNRIRGQRGVQFTNPEVVPPIAKSDLVMSFVERHQDCDYGFQREFEMLPDRFMDRTSFESDKRENVAKNRYPDIKAYDQTRVVLSTQNDMPCSDYINANFVTGYKDKKKYICAQGPMDSTVNDWWRMIWEQRISLILMLTNIEEYSKAKCAKYWPSDGSSTFGDIVVADCTETKCSVDYVMRRLRIRNCNLDSAKDCEKEREVLQMHYLVWKDFMAPEHPMGIIRFIKKFNEIYSPESEPRPPILVHCSAGVGRTGSLVALDILLAELEETGAVTIFNTICDLRHQRNYLVQSLKQYVFIYRALMEVVQFGDTQIRISDLKAIVEKHTSTQNGKSSLDLEFEKLSQVVEDRKPFLAGASEENRHRNRHGNVIPFDKSRVILSPIPNANKEVCTYINASFIEGYDHSDQFIITQDPLETTVGDFWRMIVEQNIRSVVMLSEVGEEACPRYWPEKDQETSHGFIRVKYMQSQSFPFYYRREFTITNTRTQDALLVTQFQYNGWPVGIDQVPESPRGLVELIDTTFKHKDASDSHGPKVVHCSAGADRSCIYVALAILVQQMLTESTVDVFNVVRSLRAQRQGLFQNFAQYELLYRGLLTYSELHRSNGDT